MYMCRTVVALSTAFFLDGSVVQAQDSTRHAIEQCVANCVTNVRSNLRAAIGQCLYLDGLASAVDSTDEAITLFLEGKRQEYYAYLPLLFVLINSVQSRETDGYYQVEGSISLIAQYSAVVELLDGGCRILNGYGGYVQYATTTIKQLDYS